MAITGSAELLVGVGGDRDDQAGQRGFTDEYQVFSDGISENRTTVLTAPGLPYPYQAHPEWPDAFAYQFSCEQDAGLRKRWIVSVEYKTFSGADEDGDDGNEPVANPLAKPPRITRTSETIEVPVFKDQNGKAYANSVGEPYVDPPITVPWSRGVFKVEQNLPVFNSDTHDAYENSINSDVFTLTRPGFYKQFAIGTAYLKSIEATPEKENDIPFWKRTMTIVHDRRGWNAAKDPLDYGYHWIETLAPPHPLAGRKVKRRIKTGDKKIKQTPTMLDSNGIPLLEHYQVKHAGKAAGWTINPTTDPVFNQFAHFKALPFAALNFI